jgi:hypothetical protein
MKRNKQSAITSCLLKDVVALHEANLQASMPKPAGPPSLDPSPGKPAELDQDAGGGFNATHTFPQR